MNASVWALGAARWCKAVLIGVDDTAAAVAFKDQTDLTISARCGMAQIDEARGVTSLSPAERACLLKLASWLDRIEANHCRLAITGDIDRANRVLTTLAPYAAAAAAHGGAL